MRKVNRSTKQKVIKTAIIDSVMPLPIGEELKKKNEIYEKWKESQEWINCPHGYSKLRTCLQCFDTVVNIVK